MSLETRSNSAHFKRAEQLRRWEDSDTNREPVSPKHKSRKIKFSSGCVFLAACAAGDKDEVLKLLEKGADINTANVDGLTALHQACIDDNFDMVEFLVEHGADVNRGDNEGWTPLHATASCAFLYIAKYLIEQGANVAAVNNDGELVIDIADDIRMKDLLNGEIKKRGIDCDAARNEEQRIMLQDAKEWLSNKSSLVDTPHPKNRATALHVAAAKGYTDVTTLLLQCGADVDSQDIDGWTPLHAAAHWGQEEICQVLAENLADMDSKNFVGQTPFDLADTEMFRFLEDLKKKQNKEDVQNRRQAKKRAEVQDRQIETTETPSKVKKVEVEIKAKEEIHDNNIEMDVSSESESETESSSETESNSTTDDEKKNRVNSLESNNSISNRNSEQVRLPPSVPPKQIFETNSDDIYSWRKQNARQTKVDLPSPVKAAGDIVSSTDVNNEQEIIVKRTNSYEKEEKDENNENSSSTATSTTTSPSKTTTTSPTSSPVPNNQPLRSDLKLQITPATPSVTTTTPTPTTPGGTRLQMFKNFFKSFVPPVRDEESETQRKAHAKRVRETRRSTQGVTLEEIKSAEQLVKKKNNQPNNNNNNEQFKLEDATKPSSEPPSTPSFIRRNTTTTTAQNNSSSRPSSAPVETAEATVTLSLRRPKSLEDKEQDKENDVRNAQGTLATQAAIQRRKRPKRRSTGVVNFENMDDLEQDKDPAGGGDYQDNTKVNHQESGNERSSRSRLGSTSDIRNENGEIDYKKLYEQAIAENGELKDKLKKSDQELRDTKQTLEKLKVVNSKNSLSELEKRERRAMERKLSEMEEELKHMENMKIENQKLKDENGALIRVISKLSK